MHLSVEEPELHLLAIAVQERRLVVLQFYPSFAGGDSSQLVLVELVS